MRDPATWLKLILRIAAVLMGVAVVAAVMPREWMAETHRRLGLGELPAAPIVEYLARALSAMYASFGAVLWVASGDVRRHGPVIACIAVAWGVLTPAVMFLSVMGGLPVWWVAGDMASMLAFVAAVLWLQHRLREADDGPADGPA